MVWLCVLLVSIFYSVNSVAEYKVGLKTSITASSPAMPLLDIDSSWASPRKGQYAQGRRLSELYFSFNESFSIGVHERQHYLLGFNRQTAQFYSGLENNTINDGDYDLSLSVNAASAKGVFAQYFIPLSYRGFIAIKSHLLKGERIQRGRIAGQGSVQGQSLSYNWLLDYQYDENRLFDGPRNKVRGWGHSFDITAKYQPTDRDAITLSVNDLFYRLYWDQLEQDSGCLDRPLTSTCSARTTQQNVTQTFPVFTTVAWAHKRNHYQLMVEVQHWERYNALKAGGMLGRFEANFDLVNEMLNIGYESSLLKVKWGFDDLRPAHMKHWQFTLDAGWPFL